MRAPRRPAFLLTVLALGSLSCDLLPRTAAPGALPVVAAGPELALASPAPTGPADLGDIHRFFEGRRTGLTPGEIDRVARTIDEECRRSGLSHALVLAVIAVESAGRNFAVSHAGALGLMQLLPGTGAAVARDTGETWRGPHSLFDPVINVRLGVRYLHRLIRRFGSVPTALAAYNWGPTHIAARLHRGESLPVDYPQRVLTAHAPLSES